MDRILADKKIRRLYIKYFSALLFVAVLVRLLIALSLDEAQRANRIVDILTRLSEGFFISSVVAFLVGWVIVQGTKELHEAEDAFQVLTPSEITPRFEAAQRTATRWFFKGGLGRYFTFTTLPEVLGNHNAGYELKAFVVDPFAPKLCDYVEDHRADRGPAPKPRHDVLATIVLYVREVQSHLRKVATAECWLIDDFAPLRIDLTNEGVFVTHDDDASPAMFFQAGSAFYLAYTQELTTGPNSYKLLDVYQLAQSLNTAGVRPPTNGLTDSYLSEVLDAACKRLKRPLVDAGERAIVLDVATKRRSPH